MFRLMGGFGAAVALAACNGNETSASGGGGSGGSTGGSGGSTGGSGGSTGGSQTTATTTSATGDWATGGTKVMDGKDYGNPFAAGIGSTCTVYKASTEGPCHATSDQITRKDVSEGYDGLPTRLEFLIVDQDCNPVPNATMEIWHCSTAGVYSGDIDGTNDAFCTGGDPVAAAALWYRGIQTAGADGRITFDTNFPGWYASRATHIHFKISVNGTEYIVSQLFFDEALKEEIYNSQPTYVATSKSGYQPNSGDKVISESGLVLDDVVMSTAKQSDGAMLAWKAIAISA
ncbi:MAG: hypothetical protein U0441_32965 [Polyangiaceae bacterium]